MADLELKIAVVGDLGKFMERRAQGIAKAVTQGVRTTTFGLQRELRRLVRRAKFQSKGLEKLVSSKVFPQRGFEPDAEGVVYSNAQVKRGGGEVDLLEVFDKGASIRARGGKWLAIPAQGAPTGKKSRVRAGQLQRLRERSNAAYEPGAENAGARRNVRSARKRLGSLGGAGQSELQFIPTRKPGLAMLAYDGPNGEKVVAYWLVREVTIRKRIDIAHAESKWVPKLGDRINRNLDRYVYKTGDDI